jgi:hypothetical protein
MNRPHCWIPTTTNSIATLSRRRKKESFDKVSSIRGANALFQEVSNTTGQDTSDPCGGGVEYLHCDPASRRRRRKGKFQFWNSKIWSRVPRDSDLRKTALARASGIYKRQTHPLVREGAPRKQERNCQTEIYIWSWAPDGARYQDILTDSPSVAMWLWLDNRADQRSRSEAQRQRRSKESD